MLSFVLALQGYVPCPPDLPCAAYLPVTGSVPQIFGVIERVDISRVRRFRRIRSLKERKSSVLNRLPYAFVNYFDPSSCGGFGASPFGPCLSRRSCVRLLCKCKAVSATHFLAPMPARVSGCAIAASAANGVFKKIACPHA